MAWDLYEKETFTTTASDTLGLFLVALAIYPD